MMTIRRKKTMTIALRGIICSGLVVTLMMTTGGCQNSPRPTEIIRSSGDFEYQQGRYAAAAEQYQEIADRTPGDWEAQFMLGQSLLEISRPGEARESLEVAWNLKPNDEEIAAALARAMHEQGQANELFAFLRAQADETRSTRDFMNIAKYAMLGRDYDMAEVALRTAIEVDEGQSVEPHLGMAALQKMLGNEDAVARHLREAQLINPDDLRVREQITDQARTRAGDDS